MQVNFYKSIEAILALVLFLSLPITSNAAKVRDYGNPWLGTGDMAEPKSFLRVKLAQPLTASVNKECPKITKNGLVMDDDLAILKMKPEPCYSLSQINLTGKIIVMNIYENPMYSTINIVTDNGKVDGKVVSIIAMIDESRYLVAYDLLTSKYGGPNSDAQTRTIKSRFTDNKCLGTIADWNGKYVTIHLSSISEESCGSSNYGEIVVDVKNVRQMSQLFN